MTRDKLRNIMAEAIRAATEEDATAVAERAAQATGGRRLLWFSYSVEQRASLIRSARNKAMRAKVERERTVGNAKSRDEYRP